MLNKQKREAELPVFLLLLLLDEREIIFVFGVVGTGVAGLVGKVRNALVRLADIVRITGTDLVCQLLERLGIVAALVVIGKACYLGKNRVSYSCFSGLHSSHAAVASCMKKLH